MKERMRRKRSFEKERGGGGGEEKGRKKRQQGRGREVRGEGGEQAHLYVWLPSAKGALPPPGLMNSEERSQSFLSASHHHTWLGKSFHII